MLKTPQAFWFTATSARGETGKRYAHLSQVKNSFHIQRVFVRSQSIFADFSLICTYSIEAIGHVPDWPNNQQEIVNFFT